MKKKARSSFREACALAKGSLWNGAANRAYYSLFQSVVAEFQRQGKSPADFSRSSEESSGLWSHFAVRTHCRTAHLSQRQKDIVGDAYDLRVKADYRRDSVEEWEVEDLLLEAEKILLDLGIGIK